MGDYYKILGLDPSADAYQIRAAYKRLAMQYHPDHNPGDLHAEEKFKEINEAYHTLSDSLKKSRYDTRYAPPESQPVYDWREENRRKYWRMQQAKQWTYKIDREYFKIQGLAFLVFIVIAGFCFAVVHTAYFFVEQKRLARYRADTAALKQVNVLFLTGNFDDAFTMVTTLQKNNPLELRFTFAHDSLLTELRKRGEFDFKNKNFSSAVQYFFILEHHEEPARIETLQRIAQCQYYLGNFKEALQAMKHMHNQQPENLQLIYEIALINLDQLENREEAIQYLDLGKKLFKKNLSDVYGEAFMIVMNPADAPDIYFDIFEARARTNLALRKYEEALNDCKWSIYLRPQKGVSYRLRALANMSSGTSDEVCKDLNQAKKLGDPEANTLLRQYCR
ncbi:MAG TPA: DnaJ domain-containing protein [Ohtaekwangia sp.]